MSRSIGITALWRQRSEPVEVLAERLSRWLTRLAALDPAFRRWTRANMRYRSVVPRIASLPFDIGETRTWITENPNFETREGRKQLVGYEINADTPEDVPFCATFRFSPELERVSYGYGNELYLSLGLPDDAVPDLVAFVQTIVSASGMIWDCDWAAANPGNYRDDARRPDAPRVRYRSGWMVYLDQSLAARLPRPEGIESETLPHGGILLTTVPDRLFDYDREDHCSAARRLQKALDTFNPPPLKG